MDFHAFPLTPVSLAMLDSIYAINLRAIIYLKQAVNSILHICQPGWGVIIIVKKSGLSNFWCGHFCAAVCAVKISQPEEGHHAGVYPDSNGIFNLNMLMGIKSKSSDQNKAE